MTTEPPTDRLPRIIFLWYEENLFQLIYDILAGEGYSITAMQSAQRALDRIQRHARPYLVLMDSFHALSLHTRHLVGL
jgi:CheY-like chemotaxis protein